MPADVGFLTLLEEAMLGEIDPLGHSRKRCPTTARRSRSVIERIMAHFTTGGSYTPTTGARPPNTFATTISAVVCLCFYLLV